MKLAARRGATFACAVLIGIILLPRDGVAPAQDRLPPASRGDEVFVTQGCYGCHRIGKFGTPIGPDLSRVGAKYSARDLRNWLRDPASVRSTAHMPKLELSGDEIEALAAYLASLK